MLASEVPPKRSGVARSVDVLARGLSERGHSVEILSFADIPNARIGEYRVSAFALRWPSVRRVLEEFDVVNIHGPVPTFSDAFLALSRIRRRNLPSIVYTHHCTIDMVGARLASRLYGAMAERLGHLADHVVVTTEAYRKMLRRTGRTPVHVVPWGVTNSSTSARVAPRRAGEPLRVLCVGQLRPYKGVGNLIMALAGVEATSLDVVGTGPLEARLRRLTKRRAGSNVRFLGELPDTALENEYRTHDVVVLPSVSKLEAFGLSALEGMALGCAPVVTDLPGLREVVGPSGIVVPPGDVAALRNAIVGLAGSPSRLAGLQWAAREQAARFRWDSTINAYEMLFSSAAAEGRARTRASTDLIRSPVDLVKAHVGAAMLLPSASADDPPSEPR